MFENEVSNSDIFGTKRYVQQNQKKINLCKPSNNVAYFTLHI